MNTALLLGAGALIALTVRSQTTQDHVGEGYRQASRITKPPYGYGVHVAHTRADNHEIPGITHASDTELYDSIRDSVTVPTVAAAAMHPMRNPLDGALKRKPGPGMRFH